MASTRQNAQLIRRFWKKRRQKCTNLNSSAAAVYKYKCKRETHEVQTGNTQKPTSRDPTPKMKIICNRTKKKHKSEKQTECERRYGDNFQRQIQSKVKGLTYVKISDN